MDTLDLGSRRELMVDDFLIEEMEGAELRLQHPSPRETVMSFNATWEGSGCGYVTVFEDDDRYRMYYKAWHLPVGEDGVVADGSSLHICYAESPDGIHWERPEFGLFEHDGSTANNIVFTGPGSHGFAPFKDPNPEALPEARYKAFGHGKDRDARVIWAHCSPDGVHWSRMREEPVMDCCAFDSQNLAFFDETRGEYRAYVRDFTGERIGQGLRGIKTATSPDFLNWTEPEWLGYPGAPDEQLYTNQVHPCARAPQIFIGLPARYVERGWSPSMRALPDPENREMRARTQERYGTALSDSLLMTSRDGRTFNRWGEAFVRPGIQRPGTWAYGDHYLQWQIVETESSLPGAPRELSFYSVEDYWQNNAASLRRYTLRLDGFVALHAPLSGGEMVTKPLTFEGDELFLNFATSAAGEIRVEVQDRSGAPIAGLMLDDCDPVFGDEIERAVTWRGGRSDLSVLSAEPIRLRVVMRDADLFSLRFG
ncbi:MAG: hypothetical protein ACOX9R_15890 [Armatimonadota bacterium]|jgi:hypothetical protein